MDRARALIVLARLHGERLPAVMLDRHAETAHQVQGNLDVRLRNQLARDVDGHRMVARHQRRHHQEGRQELARHVAAHGDALRVDVAAADAQRREALLARVFDLRADGVERVDQVADGALVHARHAMQRVVAADHGQRRRQRADGRAGIAHEQVRRVVREHAAAAFHVVHLVRRGRVARQFILRPFDAQRRQGRQHDEGVVGGEQVDDFRRAPGQRGQQQHAVGNAFRAGQTHRAFDVHHRLQIDMVGVVLGLGHAGILNYCVGAGASAVSIASIHCCRACWAFAYTPSMAAPSLAARWARKVVNCAR